MVTAICKKRVARTFVREDILEYYLFSRLIIELTH